MRKSEQIPKNDDWQEREDQEKKLPFFATKKGTGISAMLMAVIVAVILVYQLSGSRGTVTYEMNGELLGIVCLDRSALFIPYEQISQAQLVETFEMGTVLKADEWDGGWCADCENEQWGKYTLYAYSDVGEYIVVRYAQGTLVFNDKSKKATERAWHKLIKLAGEEGE